MLKRGRKTADDLVVVAGNFGQRPEPPEELTDRQKEIWRAVTASEPAGFFEAEATRGLLADYCRHRETAEMLTRVINDFRPEWLKSAEGAKRFRDLQRMRDMETRAAASLATKLRITNQARYTASAAATAGRRATAVKPWDVVI